jgi:ATP-dependent DNA helicase RecG
MDLTTPVEEIPRVGPQYQKRLKRLGIKTVEDIIFHFPHRYEDFSNLIPIAKAEAGGLFSFQGEILEIKNLRTPRKRMVLTQAEIYDGTGKLKVIWFNQPYLINVFKKGDYVCLSGKVAKKGNIQYLSSPAYEKLNSESLHKLELTHTGRLVPVYPETEGLSSKWLRFIIKPILTKIRNQILDPLPDKIRQKFNFLPIKEALWQIHFPDSLEQANKAKKRFAFQELFELSLFVLRERMKLAKEKAFAIPLNLPLIKEFVKSLPFKLTDAQKKAIWQILKDTEKPTPMNRLLEGDVGSGKTVVATIAAFNTAKAGYQVAFMAPTEILAKQHFNTISNFLQKFGFKIRLLIGGKKTEINDFDIIIGTHALIQEGVTFKNLALVIVDEQHRFGVEQRAKLCQQKEFIPHLLSMTATPIPRTLSLTLYGDLDLSLLDEMPKGRKKVITKIVRPQEKRMAYDFIREKIKEGRQAFVICPRIESASKSSAKQISLNEIPSQQLSLDNLKYEVKAVKEEYEKLSKIVFPDLRVGMLHGKMKTQEKEKVMQDFKDRKIDILVSTSVVEVGVDVPNATIILIEGAEKFGLAQLHQFRGRVGRSDQQSYCFLFTETPGVLTNRRLRAFVALDNGFELAEKDLQIRGPGDFLGQRQWGLPDLTMASLTDTALVEKARQEAKEILSEDPELKKYPLLKEKLKKFRQKVHLE